MNPERHQFLSLIRQVPARLTVDEAAWFLGFQPHEISILVSKHLLKPLGEPAQQSPKYFAASDLEPLRVDSKWLARASLAILLYWRHSNRRRTAGKRTGGKTQQRRSA